MYVTVKKVKKKVNPHFHGRGLNPCHPIDRSILYRVAIKKKKKKKQLVTRGSKGAL